MTLPTRIFAELLTDGETSSGVWNAQRLTTNARAYVPEDEAQNAMLEQMREALEFYADITNWRDGGFRPGNENGTQTLDWLPNSINNDGGDKARAALKAMEATQ